MPVDTNPEPTSTGQSGPHSEPVLVFQASTQEELEIVRATIEASGIRAFLNQISPDPVVGAIDPSTGTAWQRGIYVRPEDADTDRALVDDMPLTEAELDAEEQADPTTLIEAEARANAQ
jgi:hypothetical protein